MLQNKLGLLGLWLLQAVGNKPVWWHGLTVQIVLMNDWSMASQRAMPSLLTSVL